LIKISGMIRRSNGEDVRHVWDTMKEWPYPEKPEHPDWFYPDVAWIDVAKATYKGSKYLDGDGQFCAVKVCPTAAQAEFDDDFVEYRFHLFEWKSAALDWVLSCDRCGTIDTEDGGRRLKDTNRKHFVKRLPKPGATLMVPQKWWDELLALARNVKIPHLLQRAQEFVTLLKSRTGPEEAFDTLAVRMRREFLAALKIDDGHREQAQTAFELMMMQIAGGEFE
jgi:hypothetical protein